MEKASSREKTPKNKIKLKPKRFYEVLSKSKNKDLENILFIKPLTVQISKRW